MLLTESLLAGSLLFGNLFVDVNDPTADDPGDNLYSQIQEAVDAANEGDTILVAAGAYEPFVVNTDGLTIREATPNSDPVIDGTGLISTAGVIVHADGVTLQGLEVSNLTSPENVTAIAFDVVGNDNLLLANLARDNVGKSTSFIRAHVIGFSVQGKNNTLKDNEAQSNIADSPLRFGLVAGFSIEGDSNRLTGNVARSNASLGIFSNSDSAGFDVFGNSNTLIGNEAVDNERAIGFYVEFGSDANTLRQNEATGNGQRGFFLRGDNNVANGNLAGDNGQDGFAVSGFDCTLQDNLAIGNGFSSSSFVDGFAVFGSGHTFRGNEAVGNAGDGVHQQSSFFSPSHDNVYEGNSAEDNGDNGFDVTGQETVLKGNEALSNNDTNFLFREGVTLIGNLAEDSVLGGGFANHPGPKSGGDTLIGNVAQGNALEGFLLQFQFSVGKTTLQGNEALNNGDVGFKLRNVLVESTVTGNLAVNNGGDGFELLRTQGSTLEGNKAENNAAHGFLLLQDSSDNTVRDNLADGNEGQGFRLEAEGFFFFPEIVFFAPDNNVLEGNVAVNSGGDGFDLIGSSGNLLGGNAAEDNDGNGFTLEKLEFAGVTRFSDDNLLITNRAEDNLGWGFFVEAELNNMFEDNECLGNILGGSNLAGVCD